jgi:hypothetical protein
MMGDWYGFAYLDYRTFHSRQDGGDNFSSDWEGGKHLRWSQNNIAFVSVTKNPTF